MADRRRPDEPDPGAPLRGPARDDLEGVAELPVVARLIVEIRSDGTRTIARGGLEDVAQGHKVAIEAAGTSPLQLAMALARSLTQLPRLSGKLTARGAVRGLLGRTKK